MRILAWIWIAFVTITMLVGTAAVNWWAFATTSGIKQTNNSGGPAALAVVLDIGLFVMVVLTTFAAVTYLEEN